MIERACALRETKLKQILRVDRSPTSITYVYPRDEQTVIPLPALRMRLRLGICLPQIILRSTYSQIPVMVTRSKVRTSVEVS